MKLNLLIRDFEGLYFYDCLSKEKLRLQLRLCPNLTGNLPIIVNASADGSVVLRRHGGLEYHNILDREELLFPPVPISEKGIDRYQFPNNYNPWMVLSDGSLAIGPRKGHEDIVQIWSINDMLPPCDDAGDNLSPSCYGLRPLNDGIHLAPRLLSLFYKPFKTNPVCPRCVFGLSDCSIAIGGTDGSIYIWQPTKTRSILSSTEEESKPDIEVYRILFALHRNTAVHHLIIDDVPMIRGLVRYIVPMLLHNKGLRTISLRNTRLSNYMFYKILEAIIKNQETRIERIDIRNNSNLVVDREAQEQLAILRERNNLQLVIDDNVSFREHVRMAT